MRETLHTSAGVGKLANDNVGEISEAFGYGAITAMSVADSSSSKNLGYILLIGNVYVCARVWEASYRNRHEQG
jgi:hypothetical protein